MVRLVLAISAAVSIATLKTVGKFSSPWEALEEVPLVALDTVGIEKLLPVWGYHLV